MSASILILDDESAIADIFAYALGSEGYSSRRGILGSEALEHPRGSHALAILDVGLPSLSGFKVPPARTFTAIPILFLSGPSP